MYKYSIRVVGSIHTLKRSSVAKLKKLVRLARESPGIGDGRWVMLVRFENGAPVDMISIKYVEADNFLSYAGRIVDIKNNETKSTTTNRLVIIVEYNIDNSFSINLGRIGSIAGGNK